MSSARLGGAASLAPKPHTIAGKAPQVGSGTTHPARLRGSYRNRSLGRRPRPAHRSGRPGPDPTRKPPPANASASRQDRSADTSQTSRRGFSEARRRVTSSRTRRASPSTIRCRSPASVVITQRPSAARFRPFLAVSFEETWSADSDQTANTGMTCGAPSGRPKAPSCRSLFPDAEAVDPQTDRAELPRYRGRRVAQRW